MAAHPNSGLALAVDLDGTLISCAERQVSVVRAVLPERWRVRFDSDGFWRHKREGASTREALVQLGMDEREARDCAAAWVAQIEDPGWLTLDRVLPGVRDALAMLRLREIPVTLLTARRDPVALAGQLAALGLAPDFHAVEVVDPREAADAKAAHLRAARPALFVGDSETDFAAAERVGVPFIGVDTGQRSAPFLRAAGVRRVSGSLTAIVEYMDATLAGVPPGPRASIHSVDSPRTPA